MLPRIGLNLFRMGRLLEKAEYMAGYSKTQYLFYLDAPYPEHKKELLESLFNASSIRQQYLDTYGHLEEERVLYFVAIDEVNPYSIKNIVTRARELARATRDHITTDFWEYLNAFYHAMSSFSNTKLTREGFLSYTKKAIQCSLTLKGYSETVMVRDDQYCLLALGFHLERSIQASRLLLNTLNTLDRQEGYDERGQLIAMLQSTGSYETFKRLNQQGLYKRDVLYFMAFNPDFPRSIVFNFNAIQKISQEIGFFGQEEKDSLTRQLSTLIKDYPAPQEGSAKDLLFLQDTLQALREFADVVEQKYLAP